MKCRKAKKLIFSYAELDPPLKEMLDDHAKSCPHCSHELALHLRSMNLVREGIHFEESADFWKDYRVDVKRRVLPPSLWNRVQAKVERLTGLFRTPILGPVPAYVFSFALIAVLTMSLFPGFLSSSSAKGFSNDLVVYEGGLLSAIDDDGVTVYTLEGR
jgi:anti-sigma factor RsiW